MTNLLLKLTDCQEMALSWIDSSAVRNTENEPQHNPEEKDLVPRKERFWKALTMLTEAYDEWSMGPDAKTIL